MAELLKLDLHGLQEAQDLTQQMAERAQDLTPVFETGHRAFLLEMKAQFESEGAYLLGEKWEKLSPRYAAWKEQHYPGQPILQREGDLLASLTEEGDPQHFRFIAPDKAIFGSIVPYGKHHQKKRQIIKTRETFKLLLVRAMIAWVVRGRRLRDVSEAVE